MRKAIFSVAVVAALLAGSATAFADGPTYPQTGDGSSGDGTSSSGQSTSSTPPSTSTSRVNVVIRSLKYMPAYLTVSQGTTVTWMNQDTIAHTVTSDDMNNSVHFDSGTLQPGQSYSYTFSQMGTYTYHCSIHPNMTGSVNVISQPQPTPTPAPSQPSRSYTSPSVSAQANANATVNNYNYGGSGYNCTTPRTAPTTTTHTAYSTTPSYSQPATTTYRTTAALAPTSTPATTEQELPSTGPAGTVAIAAAATSLGTGGSYLYLLKRKKIS